MNYSYKSKANCQNYTSKFKLAVNQTISLSVSPSPCTYLSKFKFQTT